MTNPKFGKILVLAIFSWALMQGGAQAQQENWQASKTILSPQDIQNKIAPVCTPIDPVAAKDGHSCYILQRQCWLDNSGYGPCVTKNCKYAYALNGADLNATPMVPLHSNWYCDLNYDGTAAPLPAVVPPAECTILGEAWKHRITSDPACAPR